jgi:hypothetical protein
VQFKVTLRHATATTLQSRSVKYQLRPMTQSQCPASSILKKLIAKASFEPNADHWCLPEHIMFTFSELGTRSVALHRQHSSEKPSNVSLTHRIPLMKLF